MPTSLRSHRRQIRKARSEQQILTFSLRHQWFALPIKQVYRVIPVDSLYGTSAYGVPGLTLYQNQEIPVIDVQQRVLGAPIDAAPNYLILVPNWQGEMVGLPLLTQPSLKRIPETAITASTWLAEGGIQCVVAMAIPAPGEPPLFFLDLSQLLQPARALPPGD